MESSDETKNKRSKSLGTISLSKNMSLTTGAGLVFSDITAIRRSDVLFKYKHI